jgi:hypothetical protein
MRFQDGIGILVEIDPAIIERQNAKWATTGVPVCLEGWFPDRDNPEMLLEPNIASNV